MTSRKISNISLSDFRSFLSAQGLKVIKTTKGRGGHEKWSRADLNRPITIQTHVDPVPEFIIKQVLRHLNMSREQFFKEREK
ncbi:MAG: type II toxin-antitoxin system HicA family toxin [Bacteroidales bacterium]|jgi:hypothetical protein|nr:type II toxin-antitoxin system HicA family toxin [Bacteroidales bacterium]